MCQSDHGTMVYTHPYYGLLWFSHKEPWFSHKEPTLSPDFIAWEKQMGNFWIIVFLE